MGNSASKAASKAKPVPSRTTNQPLGSTLPSARPARPAPLPRASETKSAAIQSDGQDPTYMQNLSALGAVHVPRSPTLFRPDNRMLEILKRRKATEEAAESGPAPNRLTAQSLSNLFDERKSAKTRAEVEVLCKEYGIDIGVLEELGKHVNAPSVSSYKSLKEEVEETQMARWVDAPVEAQGQIEAR